MASTLPTRELTSAQNAFWAAQEAASAAQERLAQERAAAAQRQYALVGQMQAARTSPENAVIAQNQRLRESTDYQYQLAGLAPPQEVEGAKTDVGVREKYVTPEERVRRVAELESAQGDLRIAQAAASASSAGASVDRARIQLQMAEEKQRVDALKEREKKILEQEKEEQRLKSAPPGFTYDPESGYRYLISYSELRKRNARNGIVVDEVNGEFVTRQEMLNRTSPDGYIWRKSDSAWVDTKRGLKQINGKWIDEENGTFQDPKSKRWYRNNGDYYDPYLKSWVQAGTNYVQQGIYWVDPRTGQRYWGGKPVQKPKASSTFSADELADLTGGGSGTVPNPRRASNVVQQATNVFRGVTNF